MRYPFSAWVGSPSLTPCTAGVWEQTCCWLRENELSLSPVKSEESPSLSTQEMIVQPLGTNALALSGS
ncbi:MAG TPA: hypothetical protein VIY49_29015 [Bryobacteraceae bacterium]